MANIGRRTGLGLTATAAAFLAISAFAHAPGGVPDRSPADRVQDQMALALACHETGQKNEARDALEAALRLDPDYAPALTLMETYRARGPQAK